MSNQLVIVKHKDKVLSCLLEEKNLVQIHASEEEAKVVTGNIYIGKVKNIVKNINAAFVEVADGVMCYYSLEDRVTPIFVNQKKNQKVVIGDEIIVQVEKEGVKTKAAVVTGKISFTGKYSVISYGNTKLGISNKITNEKIKTRLKSIMDEYKNEEYGFVMRTNAAEASEEDIRAELELLIKRYESIREHGVYRSCFSVLSKSPASYLCDIRDGYDAEIEQIITDDLDLYEEIKSYLAEHQENDLSKLVLHDDKMISLKCLYSIDTKLEKALQERVWLKSGGYLVIQPTEALVVVDVNTGKAIAGKRKAEDTFFKINKEAAIEIAKQVRLRNLSGIIIIDFIDVKNQEYKDELMSLLRSLFRKDPIRTIVIGMTPLNLVEVTRKKVRKPLHEQM